MAELVRPKIQLLASREDGAYGKFLVEPLERGFGTTLGNSLRRILLSFIQGLAFTSVRIEGVVHEFSTIPGVYEDTTEILLNLKNVCLKRVSEGANVPDLPEDQVWTARIEASGECEVTASDIQCPPEVQVARPDHHIAHLTRPDAELRMELELMAGRGYRPATQQEPSSEIGRIPMDSIFSPVRKANYFVEPTRLGHKTDFDRLILEVWTNGGVMAAKAISEAARVLDQYLRYFFDFRAVSHGAEHDADEAAPGESAVLDYRIEDLDFSVRTFNCLKKESILTMRELVQRTEQDLMAIRNFGKKSLDEVRVKLAQHGLSLAQPDVQDEADADEDEEGGRDSGLALEVDEDEDDGNGRWGA